jgi:hypothetical protein
VTVQVPRFPRGSEWRRWDLHIHTPRSELNNGFGRDFDRYAKLLFEKAVKADVAVIGVTDYFTIEGYKQLHSLVADDERLVAVVGEEIAAAARHILLLPNIEFRTREVIHSAKTDARVNFHILFSEQLEPSVIEDRFLHVLRFTAESAPDSPDQRHVLNERNLAELGKRLKAEQAGLSGTDLAVGMQMAVVSHEDITEVLTDDRRTFKDRYLCIVPVDEDLSSIPWVSQAHLVRKVLVQKAHMFFSANPGTRQFGLGRKHASVDESRSEFGPLKPCVHGSDAHNPETLFRPDRDRFLWIKADPTFDGLRQLLHEPADRVHIGAEAPCTSDRQNRATKYLRELEFSRTSDERPDERWFEGTVPLNPGLVAIIGKKGSGKSALADILGLVGNAYSKADFSFLTPTRFLSPRQRLGDLFRAEILWHSEERSHRTLGDSPDTAMPERVEYLPQNYLERVCSELQDASSETTFDRELEAVVFSHVDSSERLGRTTLQELINYRTAEKEASIRPLQTRLGRVNREVVSLRRRLTRDYSRQLEGRIAQRERELEAHDRARPGQVADPGKGSNETDATATTRRQLGATVDDIQRLDAQIARARAQRDEANRRLAALQRLTDRVENLARAVEQFYEDSADDLHLAGVDGRSLVRLLTDVDALRRATRIEIARRSQLDGSLNLDISTSLVARRRAASRRADEMRTRLDEPTRRHEEYLRRLAVWHRQRDEIVGDANLPASLEGLRSELQGIEGNRESLLAAQEARNGLMQKIFSAKADLLSDYSALHAPVERFIRSHPVAREIDEMDFSTSIAVDGLVDGLLAMIHQGRKGSFQGEQEGRARLRALIASHDFSTLDGVSRFLEEIGDHLRSDVRGETPESTSLENQLIQSATPERVYDFLFGLSYLRPRFALQWRRKPLDQLSPGERGSLLLIFYLLIDQSDCPLIIDQPEENLDNETIHELLVPAIKYARERRQVIIVTHNPNLAVVCDADQVIHASIDKALGNAIRYTTGSIEDPAVTRRIIDVLEGTKPAFDLRDAKYDVLDRIVT